MGKLLLIVLFSLIGSPAFAQQATWVLWYEGTMMSDEGKTLMVHHDPVLETSTLLACNNAKEASLVAEAKQPNVKRSHDIVIARVEGSKIIVAKTWHCYMYGYDPRFKK